jgi:hypothetical protein
MKTLNITVKTIAALCIMGAIILMGVFFSCSVNDTDKNGTLVIQLPGSRSARLAEEGNGISSEFIDTLSYRIECSGPVKVNPLDINKDDKKPNASISLAPGMWNVTLTVFNAAGEDIGVSKPIPVKIESGETSPVSIPVSIDTTRNDITSFEITDPEFIIGDIEENTITIFVTQDTKIQNMKFSVTHTGKFINHESDTSLDFNQPQTFTVEAENKKTKDYTVNVRKYDDGEFPYYPEKLPLSGKVFLSTTPISSNAQIYSPSVSVSSNIGVTGTISGGNLTFDVPLPPPEKLTLFTAKEWAKFNEWHKNVTLSKSDVKYVFLSLSVTDEQKKQYTLSKNRNKLWDNSDNVDRTVRYLYVDQDVIVRAPEIKRNKNKEGIAVSSLGLSLKQGWNAIYIRDDRRNKNRIIYLRNRNHDWALIPTK